jgi:spermidine/putrescine ABC transporter ATP-binding subunit
VSMVELRNVSKSFGQVKAVDEVSLQVKAGEMLCLLGPSGCGKTTLLRILSGFLQPDQGVIIMDNQDVTGLPPEKRPTSLVFQNYALFPHLNVFENVAFGLKIKKLPMAEIRKSVAEILEVVGLSGTEKRSIRQLSGGQQQRIALARALVMKPSVLLLDEPLSNLDAKLRVETRVHIQQIQKSVGITAIFVTHDQEEALSISDRIAIMQKGKIVQIGTPEEIYANPNSKFVADFIGKSNILAGELKVDQSGQNVFKLDSGLEFKVSKGTKARGKGVFVLRPEHIQIATQPVAQVESLNVVNAKIEHVTFLGEVSYYRVKIQGNEELLVPLYGVSQSNINVGDSVILTWPEDAGVFLKE